MSDSQIRWGGMVLLGIVCLASACSKAKPPQLGPMTPERAKCAKELRQIAKEAGTTHGLLAGKGNSLVEPAQGLEKLMDRLDNLYKAGLIDEYFYRYSLEPVETAARSIGLELRKVPRTGQPRLGALPPSEIDRGRARAQLEKLAMDLLVPIQITEGKAIGDIEWRDGKLWSASWQRAHVLRDSPDRGVAGGDRQNPRR